jgi:predicted small metal-binding protein
MPSFRCKDIGMKCDFEATAENEADLEKKIAEHARSVHNMDPVSADMWQKIKKVVR